MTRRLSVQARFLAEPCLWCWDLVDEDSGETIESSWDSAWSGYPSQAEALAAGRDWLRTITELEGEEAATRR